VDFSSVAIDLYFAGVRTAASGEFARVINRAALETKLNVGRIAGRMVGDPLDTVTR
jgi:hypothetical protein